MLHIYDWRGSKQNRRKWEMCDMSGFSTSSSRKVVIASLGSERISWRLRHAAGAVCCVGVGGTSGFCPWMLLSSLQPLEIKTVIFKTPLRGQTGVFIVSSFPPERRWTKGL